MKALLLEAPKNFKRVETDPPREPRPGEALVRVHRIGICGTDISGYLGKMPFFSYPRIPGHELGIEVLEVGAGVTNVRPGDRCSVAPYLNDPNSYASRRGTPTAVRSSRCSASIVTAECARNSCCRPASQCSEMRKDWTD
jgi:threonine dehydrogenase-like Zn-dependent dehydrogenase